MRESEPKSLGPGPGWEGAGGLQLPGEAPSPLQTPDRL